MMMQYFLEQVRNKAHSSHDERRAKNRSPKPSGRMVMAHHSASTGSEASDFLDRSVVPYERHYWTKRMPSPD